MTGALPAAPVFGEAVQPLFALTGNTGVSAAAGAGKTTALVELVVRLLAGEVPGRALSPRDLVAITFTERAGAELSERLTQALQRRLDEAAGAGGEAAARLAAALRELPQMAVGTIHGFTARLLREHAVDAGVDPEFEVLDEESSAEMLAEAALGAVVAALDGGSPEVRALVAGLGGVQEVASTVERLARGRATRGFAGAPGFVPGDDAALARAVAEAEEAAREVVGLGAGATTATGRRCVTDLARHLAEPEAAEAVEPEAGRAAVLRRMEAIAGAVSGWRFGKNDAPALREARDRLLERAGAVAPLAAEREAEPGARALAAILGDAERRYRESRERAGALDFDDLLTRARDLLAGSAAVRDDVRARTRVLLVDEFQDVNRLQAEIFELLAGPGSGDRDGDGDRPATLVAVGDARQSIYRFRGADVGVFTELLRRLGPGGEGRVLHLSENRRSSPAVIGLVNEVLDRCAAGLGVPAGDEDRLRAVRAGGDDPAAELLEVGGGASGERREAEARALAARLRQLASGQAGVLVPAPGDGAGAAPRAPRWGDMAILLRRLTHVAPYERALRALGVPVRLARGGGFYQAPEVRDLGELAASVADPTDEIAWAALLRSPLCAISDGSLFLLARGRLARLAGMPPAEVVAGLDRLAGVLADGEGERLRRFLEAWHRARAARDRAGVGDLLERAAAELDLEAALLASPDGERRAGNLRKALEMAHRAAARGVTAGAFGARLRRLAARPPREPEAEPGAEDAVSLLTVHQAKGLEWPVVAIPDLAARAPPDRRPALLDEQGRVAVAWLDPATGSPVETATLARVKAASAGAEAAESLRLLYVALTRARDHLVLSGAGGRLDRGTWAEVITAVPPGRLPRRTVEPVAQEVSTAGSVTAPAPAPVPAAASPDAPPPGTASPVLRPRAAPVAVRMAVTQVAEYARCARRHWLCRELRLPEPRVGERGGDDPDRATAQGTLAHALLAEVDLGAPPLLRRGLLAAAAERRGHDPSGPVAARIIADVERFLGSAGGRRLAAAARDGRLSREVPFLLRIDGAPPVYLDGAIDALVDGPDELEIIDFKYAAAHRESVERYRLQLLAYAAAAMRAWPGRRVHATLQFLRGGAPAVDVPVDAASVDRFAAAAPGLAAGAASGGGRDVDPAGLGRDEARCRAEGCGWVGRCFPATPPGRRAIETARAHADPPNPSHPTRSVR